MIAHLAFKGRTEIAKEGVPFAYSKGKKCKHFLPDGLYSVNGERMLVSDGYLRSSHTFFVTQVGRYDARPTFVRRYLSFDEHDQAAQAAAARTAGFE